MGRSYSFAEMQSAYSTTPVVESGVFYVGLCVCMLVCICVYIDMYAWEGL